MTHASVFSGIGGPEVAATMLGWENLFHCEINPFGRQVLDYWYPNAESYDDITTTDFTKWRGRVDVLTGGFPCQPFSYAGRRRGAEDDRYLWPSMYRAIDEIQPTWVVAENVAGILTMVEQGEVSKVAGTASLFDASDDVRGRYELRETFTLQRICTDLESHGYAVQPVLVPACAVGAPHRRDRVFIVARRVASDSDNGADRRTAREDEGKGREERIQERQDAVHRPRNVADTERERLLSSEQKQRPRPEEGLSSRGGSRYVGERETESKFSCATRRIHGEITDVESSQRRDHAGHGGATEEIQSTPHPDSHRGSEVDEHMESELADGAKPVSNGGQRNVADTGNGEADTRDGYASDSSWHRLARLLQREEHGDARGQGQIAQDITDHIRSVSPDNGRWEAFPSVSPVHRGNDGLPFDVDRLTLSFGKWRTEALKAYGNAIVPQVMYEIFRAIEQVERGGE